MKELILHFISQSMFTVDYMFNFLNVAYKIWVRHMLRDQIEPRARNIRYCDERHGQSPCL